MKRWGDMRIRFTKQREDKASFACIRDNGRVTGMPSTAFFVEHDLAHYAIETTLGYDQAFYGLLASGWNIEDFGQPDHKTGQKPEIPLQAGYAEALVGLLQLMLRGSLTREDFPVAMAQIPVPAGVEAPHVNAQQLDTMYTRLELLLEEWQDLPPGATLELPFPI